MTRMPDGFMIGKRDDFYEKMRAANPEGTALLDRNKAKAEIAMTLRGMRKDMGLTQDELRQASETLGRPLTQPMISRMESPLGPMPNLDSLARYMAACGGRMQLEFFYMPGGDQRRFEHVTLA